MKRYSFSVDHRENVNFSRIIKEAIAEDSVGVIVTKKGEQNALLMLDVGWLKRFEVADGLKIANRTLEDNWGSHERPRITAEGYLLTDYTSNEMSYGAIIVKRADVGKIMGEIEAAKAYRRSIKITVIPL